MIIKEKDQGGVAEKEAGCPTSLASQGQERCPLTGGAVRNGNVSQKPPSPPWTCQFAGIINLSLVKYKDCKSQHDPAPLGGLHLSATDLG